MNNNGYDASQAYYSETHNTQFLAVSTANRRDKLYQNRDHVHRAKYEEKTEQRDCIVAERLRIAFYTTSRENKHQLEESHRNVFLR